MLFYKQSLDRKSVNVITVWGSALKEMESDSMGHVDTDRYLFINGCGYEHYITKDNVIIREKGRKDYQMIYVKAGKCVFKNADTFITVPAGSLIVFKPDEPQHYAYNHTDSTEICWIHFTGNGTDALLRNLGLDKRSYFSVGQNPAYTGLFTKLMHELQLKKTAFEEITVACFLELTALFSRALPANCQRSADIVRDSFDEVIGLMHFEYKFNRPVSYYAGKCNLSLCHFTHKFQRIMHISPARYLTQIRINTAKDLLSSSALNISDIAHVIGYENPLYFSRVFKKETGLSPTDYKQISRKNIPAEMPTQ